MRFGAVFLAIIVGRARSKCPSAKICHTVAFKERDWEGMLASPCCHVQKPHYSDLESTVCVVEASTQKQKPLGLAQGLRVWCVHVFQNTLRFVM